MSPHARIDLCCSRAPSPAPTCLRRKHREATNTHPCRGGRSLDGCGAPGERRNHATPQQGRHVCRRVGRLRGRPARAVRHAVGPPRLVEARGPARLRGRCSPPRRRPRRTGSAHSSSIRAGPGDGGVRYVHRSLYPSSPTRLCRPGSTSSASIREASVTAPPICTCGIPALTPSDTPSSPVHSGGVRRDGGSQSRGREELPPGDRPTAAATLTPSAWPATTRRCESPWVCQR